MARGCRASGRPDQVTGGRRGSVPCRIKVKACWRTWSSTRWQPPWLYLKRTQGTGAARRREMGDTGRPSGSWRTEGSCGTRACWSGAQGGQRCCSGTALMLLWPREGETEISERKGEKRGRGHGQGRDLSGRRRRASARLVGVLATRECADEGGCEDSTLLVFGEDEGEARQLGDGSPQSGSRTTAGCRGGSSRGR